MAVASVGPVLESSEHQCRSVAESRGLGARLAKELLTRSNDVEIVLLEGEMGVGKTELVKGMAAGLGIDEAEVQSPTYSLIHEHRNEEGLQLVHVDLYRVEPEQLDGLGLDELLSGPGIKAIEWWSKLGYVPPGSVVVRIERIEKGARRVTIRGRHA